MGHNHNRVRDLVDSALNGQVVFHLALMAGTGFAANAAIFPKIVEFGIPDNAASLLAALIGVLAAVAIDGGFKRQLPYAVSVLSGKKDRATGVERKKGFNVIVIILVLITGGSSLFFNWKVTPEITSGIIKEPDGATHTALSATLSNKYDRDVQRLEKAVDRAAAGLAKAESNAAQAQKDAVAALGSKMARLVKDGNAWAIQQTAAAKRKAERRYTKLIAQAQQKLDAAESALSAHVSGTGSEVSTAQASIVQDLETEKQQARQAQTRWGSAFIVFWIVCFIGFMASTVVVVVYEDETGEDVTHNPTVLSVIWKSITRVKDVVLAFVIRKAKLESAFTMPALAGSAILQPAPTPQHRPTENRNTGTQNRSQNTGNSTEKTDCKSGKCDSDKGSAARETQRTAENGSAEATQNAVLHAQNSEGQEWPTPDNKPEWDKLVKRAREWAKNSMVDTTGENGEVDAKKERTRLKNQIRWKVFVKFANAHGYRAGIGKSGVPFVNNDPEPVWSEDGTTVYFGSRSEDFDEE